MIEFEGCI